MWFVREQDDAVSDDFDETDLTAAEFRAARSSGTPVEVVTSRAEFEARSQRSQGRLEVYRDKAGKFRFRIKSSAGDIIVVSEAYLSKDAAIRAAQSVQQAAMSARIELVAS